MSVCHYSAERTLLPWKIHSIYHLYFLKTERVNIFSSHLPLYPIHQINRDADEHLKFSNLGCLDLFTSSYNHDVDSIMVNLSKALVYNDLSVNEERKANVKDEREAPKRS